MGFLGAARFCLPGGDWTSVCSSSVGEHDRCERADQCHTRSEYDRGPWPSYRGRAQPIVTYCWPSVSLLLFYDPCFRRRHVNLPWATVLRQAQLTEFRASILHRVRGRMECVLPGSEASGFCFLMKLNCGQCVLWLPCLTQEASGWPSLAVMSRSPRDRCLFSLSSVNANRNRKILLAFQYIDEPW